MLSLTEKELTCLLNEAFEEGLCSYKELQNGFVQSLIDKFKKNNIANVESTTYHVGTQFSQNDIYKMIGSFNSNFN